MKIDLRQLWEFVDESNRIERITRNPLTEELQELHSFLQEPIMTVERLEKFVSVYEPKAKLRDQFGRDVRVGNHIPPFGDPQMREWLNNILTSNMDHHDMHIKYEQLHPFMDCNGRSGRALWAWRRQSLEGGFLLSFYFDQLRRAK